MTTSHISGKRPNFFVLLALLCAANQVLFSQGFVPFIASAENYSLEASIRQFESYDIKTDGNGYVFFAGPQGIHRYNGQQMVKLQERSSYAGISYISLFEDMKGNMWAVSFANGLFQLEGDSILPFEHQASLKKFWAGRPFEYYFDSTDILHIGAKGMGYWQCDPQGTLTEVHGRSDGLFGMFIYQLLDGRLIFFSVTNPEGWKDKEIQVYFGQQDGTCRPIGTLPNGLTNIARVFQDGQSWYISNGSRALIEGFSDSIIHHARLPGNIINIFKDSRANLWIGTLGHGIVRLPKRLGSDTLRMLAGHSAAVTSEGPDGELWIKSDRSFFYCIPDSGLTFYAPDPSAKGPTKVMGITTSDSALYGLLSSSEVFHLKGRSFSRLSAPRIPAMDSKREDDRIALTLVPGRHPVELYLLYWSNVATWNGTAWSMLCADHDRSLPFKPMNLLFSGSMALIGTAKHGLYSPLDGCYQPFSGFDRHRQKNVYSWCKGPLGKIWFGSETGIWKYENGSIDRPELKSDMRHFTEHKTTDIGFLETNLLANSQTEGLFRISDGQVNRINDQYGMRIHATNFIPDHNGGIFMYAIDRVGKIVHVGMRDGAPTARLLQFSDFTSGFGMLDQSLAVIGGDLYVGTLGGVFKKSITDLQEFGPKPRVLIKDVFIAQRPWDKDSVKELRYNENNLNLRLDVINFRQQKHDIQCRLIGLDSHWNTIAFNAIQYTNLDPGGYRYEVRCRIPGEEWSPVSQLSFTILTPFWLTWWFSLLATLFLIGLTSLVSLAWFRAQHRSDLLKIGKASAEQQALRAQLNPHFIFNALGSMQDIVYNGDRNIAVTYIARFAKLIRKILAHSGRQTISVSEEVLTLKQYFELESLRFDDKFSYELIIDPELDAEQTMLPPLLLQPLVENAIMHGLMNKKPPGGHISVSFKMSKDQMLLCSVSDDGIGRMKAAELREKRNVEEASFGLRSIRERLDLYNANRKDKIQMNIQDRYNSSDLAVGTSIHVIIPQKK